MPRHGYIVLYVRSTYVLRMSIRIKKKDTIQDDYRDGAFLAILVLFSQGDLHDVIVSQFDRTKKFFSSVIFVQYS